jgi:hypothetical protein
MAAAATSEETTVETEHPKPPADRRRTIGLAFLGVLALLSLVAVAVVALSGPDAGQRAGGNRQGLAGGGTGGVSAQPSAAATPTPPTPTAAATPNAQPTPTHGGGHGGQQQGAQVVYFRLKQQPVCGAGGNHTPAIVEWKVSGATGAALSVDNPGIVGSYRSYQGATGSETLHFSCGGRPGTRESHVYTIYTVGGATQKSQTINATATVPGAAATPTPTPSAGS